METKFDILIQPGRSEINYWKDLWKFRELFYILSWRDIKVRYKQTVIGAAWAIIRPLLTMAVFTVVFGRIAKLPPEGSAPYMLLVFSGLLPWHFFSTSLSEASNSLVTNANLVNKVYFPRLIIPASAVITSLVDLAISFGLMAIMMLFYQFSPNWHIVFLPLMLILALVASFGISLSFTALNVKYRDFRYVIPFVVQLGLYISPVGFSSSIVPEQWRIFYYLNPMVGVIDGFRWCLLATPTLDLVSVGMSIAISTAFLIFGLMYFRRTERSFADFI
ncbi:MAG: ABC transporter permease [Bacteroidota bacterium]